MRHTEIRLKLPTELVAALDEMAELLKMQKDEIARRALMAQIAKMEKEDAAKLLRARTRAISRLKP